MKTNISSRTLLLGIGALVGVLVIVAIVVVLQPTQVFDPATPEGTAQGYFQAINRGDETLAETYMTDELVEACAGRWDFYGKNGDHRVAITDLVIEGDTATLEVSIALSSDPGPFGGGSYERDETVTMERHGTVWLISEPTWPMRRFACERGG